MEFNVTSLERFNGTILGKGTLTAKDEEGEKQARAY